MLKYNIKMVEFVKYKFTNSMFTGLSIGAIFTIYKPLSPIVFSIGGIVLAIFMTAGYGNTAFYPSYADLQSSLTIQNASGSYTGLKTMFFVSFAVPLVLLEVGYTWYVMRKPINEEDVEDKHAY